jgi:hypothetical protein
MLFHWLSKRKTANPFHAQSGEMKTLMVLKRIANLFCRKKATPCPLKS